MRRVVKERDATLSTVHFSELDHARANPNEVAELFPGEALTTRRYPRCPDAQRAREERAPVAYSREAMADDFYTDTRDEDLYVEVYTTQAVSTYDITHMSQFSQLTTRMPPSLDWKTSWFAYEDAIDDWCDIAESDEDKRGPALRN